MGMKIVKNQSGSTSLFVVACVLPLLFLAFSLSLDVSHYLKTLRNVNQTLDEAALNAYRYMPDQTAAMAAARAYLNAHGNYADKVQISADDAGILLQFNGQSKIIFAELLGFKEGIPLQVVSRVRGTPYDVMVVMDAGSYLAPPAGSPAWRNNLNSSDPSPWYEARYFEDKHGDFDEDPLLLTQKCFNPAFNPIKVTALSAVKFFSQSKMNAVGAAIYPASELQASYLITPVVQQGRFQAHWSPFSNFQIYCVAMAESEEVGSRYAFPTDAGSTFQKRVYQGDTLQYNEDYAPSVSDLIWSYPVQSKVGDFAEAINVIYKQLLASDLIHERGGLTGYAQKTAIVIAGDLPWSDGKRYPQVSKTLSNNLAVMKRSVLNLGLDFKLYYLLWGHQGISVTDSEVSSLSHYFESIAAHSESASFHLKLVYAESFDEFLKQRLLDGVLLDKRNAVVSK